MRWSHPALEALARLLVERTGLAFAAGRRAGFEAGIGRVMARAGVRDPSVYLDIVRSDPDPHALDDLIAELTVGETYFFREPDQFRALREEILPEIRGLRGEGHVFRAWSAGCASGEEAYSMAIVLLETFGPGRSHLMATDISYEALAKARSADFGAWSLRGADSEPALPYLRPGGDRFELAESVRKLVTPGYLNLALDAYPSARSGIWEMDLIFCRNVLIYLDKATVRAVARRLFDSLAEGGWLITASSDPPLVDIAPFEPVVTDRGIFYRRGPTPASSSPTPDQEGPLPRSASARDLNLGEAREAMSRGDYARAAHLTLGLGGVDALVLRVRALANLDPKAAERASADSTARHPLSDELRHLRAVLLLTLGLDAEAAREARHAVYLDRTSAMAHFTLGSALLRLGNKPGARRAFRNARDLAAARPFEEPVRLADGETAGRLARAAESQLARLEGRVEAGLGIGDSP